MSVGDLLLSYYLILFPILLFDLYVSSLVLLVKISSWLVLILLVLDSVVFCEWISDHLLLWNDELLLLKFSLETTLINDLFNSISFLDVLICLSDLLEIGLVLLLVIVLVLFMTLLVHYNLSCLLRSILVLKYV